MKWWLSIGIVLMVVLAGCGYSPDSPGLRPPPHRGGRPHPGPLLQEREIAGRGGWDKDSPGLRPPPQEGERQI